jgi:hypothetical protein
MINIAEILKSVPTGTKLYSPLIGECILEEVNDDDNYPIKVKVSDNDDLVEHFTKDGKYFDGAYGVNGECLLFPSKENRDWNKFEVEKPYKFKPFDPVLVRDMTSDDWRCNYFSHIDGENYICMGSSWNYCIPYNDETKHLIGTNKSFM